MKTSKKFKAFCTHLAAMLLAVVLFAGMADPAYAFSFKNTDDEDEIIVTCDDGSTMTVNLNNPDDVYKIIEISFTEVDDLNFFIKYNEEFVRYHLKKIGFSDEAINGFFDNWSNGDKSNNNKGTETTTIIDRTGGKATVTVDKNNPEASREELKKAGYTDEEIDKLIADIGDVFKGIRTSEDAKVLSESHIGYDWVEIDWSTAGDSYVRVKVNKLPGPSAIAKCYTSWNNNGTLNQCGEVGAVPLTEGEWTNIPLTGGSTEYVIRVNLSFKACEHYRTDEENAACDEWPSQLTARFDAEITNPDNLWLLSTYKVDWEHAPKTREKALEITKTCKTDAEKITAVFKWVSQSIKYDKAMYESDVKAEIARKTATKEPEKTRDDYASEEEYMIDTFGCMYDPVKGAHIVPPATPTAQELEKLGYTNQDHLDLDYILTHKTGVCEHYAVLMVGMLRSLGIQCKLVEGWMYTGKTIKGYNDDKPGWGLHAWVAVNPKTGTLNKSSLGAGKDYSTPVIGKPSEATGWIRLDPTNAKSKSVTSNDKKYEVRENY